MADQQNPKPRTSIGFRVREPDIRAVFTVEASWADGTDPEALRKLATETYAAIMQRLPE